MQKKGIITQSNYIPWKGYFYSIDEVDTYVVYDDVQYTRRDWRNRNLIKTPQGLKWLTIPVDVKGKYYQKIKDAKIAKSGWNKSHWDTIKQNYKDAKCFKEMSIWLEPLYMNCKYEFLTDINLYFIKNINEFLGIETDIRFSSEFDLPEDKTQRLVNICKELKVTDYYTGDSAKSYIDINKFSEEDINVHYWDFQGFPTYRQLHGEFVHGVSIIDLIMNEGNDTPYFLKKTV
ncbi:MAG: WbqC family protein [Chitinophagales bacterium]